MQEQDLDWEDGYRAGIERCLMLVMLCNDHKDICRRMIRMHEESVARTDRMLGRMEEVLGGK